MSQCVPTFSIVFRCLMLLALLPFPAFMPSHWPVQTQPAQSVETPSATSEPGDAPFETPTQTETPTGAPSETPVPTPTSTLDLSEAVSDLAASKPPANQPTLILSSSPGFITPGARLTLRWDVSGLSASDNPLTLRIFLPPGADPELPAAGLLDEATRLLSLPLNNPRGSLQITISQPDADALFLAEVLQGDTILASASLRVPFHEQFSLDTRGGSIQTRRGNIRVEFPTNAFSETTIVEIGPPALDSAPPFSLSGSPFEIRAFADATQSEVSQFDQAISIFVSYADWHIPPELEDDLTLYWYDPGLGDWVPLPTFVDKDAKVLRGITDHFTVFDININNWQAARLPTVDSFQVASFTGAATYSLPIEVPPGPGGFAPSLNLTYNSQIVDQSTLHTQASWVGMGWSLDTGYIELAPFRGITDTHLLNFNGISTRIVMDPSGVYHAADEDFSRITFSNNTWTVQDGQGTTYTFGYVSSYPYETGSGCPDPATGVEYKANRWSLSKVTNSFGQEILYSYSTQSRTAGFWQYYTATGECKLINKEIVNAIYPNAITYAGGRYRIRFDKGASPNRLDYPVGWDAGTAFRPFEKYRLQNIFIEQDLDGNGVFETILRRYAFSYYADADPNIIFPGHTWTAGGKTTTLKSVQQFGVGNTTALPAATFFYSDNLHLTKAENGYGGRVEFTYETNPWYYAPHARKSFTDLDKFGRGNGSPCSPYYFWPWTGRQGSILECEDNSVAPNALQVRGTAFVPYNTNSDAFRPWIRPGGRYKLTASYALDAGMSLKLGVNDGFSDSLSGVNANTFEFTLRPDAGQVSPLIQTTGTSGYARMVTFKFELLTSIYRVTQKRLYDGNGNMYAYGYAYTGAAVNDPGTSSGACPFTVDTFGEVINEAGCAEYYQKFSEFRGHSQVTETAWDGRQTITVFHQGDFLKGRPISVTTRYAGRDLSATAYTYDINQLPLSSEYRDCHVCTVYRGLYRYWIANNAIEKSIFDAAGTRVDGTRSVFTFDPTYGNLLTHTEQKDGADGWKTYRSQTHYYWPNTSLYLVSLPGKTKIFDAAGNTLGITIYLYGGNTGDHQVAPTNAQLTAVRTLMELPNKYSQVSYTYDGWGNRTSLTTYSGDGGWNASPTTGAATTTTTTYDPIFRAYPLSQVSPPTPNVPAGLTTAWEYDFDNNGVNDYILGLPTRETDPNGNATSARYDAFGRMSMLIRPGDSVASPTLTFAYSNAFPFTTTLTQKINAAQSYTITRIYDGMGRQTRSMSGDAIVDFTPPYLDNGKVISKQSMPYFSGETPAHTTTSVDYLNNAVTVTAPDGVSTTTTSNGLTTSVSDGKGSLTTTTSDMWGRVVSVAPPTGPAIAYTYDPLNRLLSAARGAPPPSDPANPGKTGLVSWWSMNETSGTRYDSYGSNHLTSNNNAGYAAGLKGNAARFAPASAQYLSRTDNASISTGDIDFTLAAHVYLNSASNIMVIANKGLQSSSIRDYVLFYNSSNAKFTFSVGNGTASGSVSSQQTVTTGQWYTIMAWHDAVNNTLNIQVNNGTVSTVSYASGAMDTTYPLTIGAHADGGAAFDGRIDEVALYKRVLNPAERAWLHNNGLARAYADLTPPPVSGSAPTTSITYAAAGRKTSMTDPDMGAWSYQYDALGNLTRQTDARGQRICLYYDALGRLIGKHYRTDDNCPTSNPTFDVSYTYDQGANGRGRRTAMTDASGSAAWLYDSRGRMTSETKVISNQSFTTAWAYNAADMPISMTYPDGEALTYGYNSRMLLESVIGASAYVSSALYDSTGRMTQRGLGNGLTQTYTYHAWNEKATVDGVLTGQGGRLKNLTVGTLQNLSYLYDAAGNIKQITNPLAGETNLYGYDALNRLTSWTLNPLPGTGGVTEAYTYNASTGNLETKAGVTLQYNDAAHVHAVTNAGGNTYQYDANGNQTTRVIGSDTFTLLYDAENRLVEVKKNSVTIAQFTFDGDGRRVKSVMGSETLLFVGAHYEVKNPGAGQQVTKYYFAGMTRIAVRKYTIPQSMNVEYFLGDHLGSTSITTDSTGAKVSEMRYKPWGEIRYSWTANPSTAPAYKLTDYTFTGQFSHIDDPSTPEVTEGFGLMFYNARWYDPVIGRFAQADTVVPPGIQGLDRYAYVNNSPIMYVDPSGHSYCDSKYALKEDCEEAGGEAKFGNSNSGNRRNNNSSTVECGSQCAASDIASWSIDNRIDWFRWLLSSYNIRQSWFNNIFGILDVFNKYGLGETATGAGADDWVSWTDAGILVSIQDGLTGRGNYEAAIRWKAFFATFDPKVQGSISDAARVYLWGQAEAAGTAYGLFLAGNHRPDIQNQAFLFVGDTYRSVMGVPYGGQLVGGISGGVATGYEGLKICGPLCAVGGVLLGGTGGAYIGGNIVDPRTMWGNHPPVYYVADAILGFGR